METVKPSYTTGFFIVFVVLAVIGGLFYWQQSFTGDQELASMMEESPMEIQSPAFNNNEQIPDIYTCEGQDINPPLQWDGVPESAESLVLIVDDPDAPSGTWDHWLVVNISPDTTGVEEDAIPEGGIQIQNDFQQENYGGPCPPQGSDHRYFFKLYALDTKLNDAQISGKEDIIASMTSHLITKTELVGTYNR